MQKPHLTCGGDAFASKKTQKGHHVNSNHAQQRTDSAGRPETGKRSDSREYSAADIADDRSSWKNFQKTTKALRCFFDTAQKLDNSYIMALGYALSAELNFEVYKRNLSNVSLEKTEKLYVSATSLFESVGAWHEVARTLRLYAIFLDALNRRDDAHNSLKRADKVDPYRQL